MMQLAQSANVQGGMRRVSLSQRPMSILTRSISVGANQSVATDTSVKQGGEGEQKAPRRCVFLLFLPIV